MLKKKKKTLFFVYLLWTSVKTVWFVSVGVLESGNYFVNSYREQRVFSYNSQDVRDFNNISCFTKLILVFSLLKIILKSVVSVNSKFQPSMIPTRRHRCRLIKRQKKSTSRKKNRNEISDRDPMNIISHLHAVARF